MSRGSRLVGFLFIAALCLAALDVPGVATARACGGFFRSKQISPEERPSLWREKVLIIHDEAKGEQHFVREVAFQKAKEPFGFVVPTPTRPSVDKIKKTPFTDLRNMFPFMSREGIGFVGRGGGGKGTRAAPGGGVQVLEKKKVGSFTAFVLAATDEQALANWLEKNGLVSAEDTDAWLAHYVRMGFFYVAMRYDPPRKAAPLQLLTPIDAETIRISFATPVPFYPYLEPAEAKTGEPKPRLLELWYVGTRAVVPVALRNRGEKQAWVQPLKPGEHYTGVRSRLGGAYKKEILELLPAEGELHLQTFQDQKFSRAGFEDILFAAKEPRELDAEQVAQLEPLLGILDPQLRSEAK